MSRRPILGFLIAPLTPCVLAATIASLRLVDLLAIPFGTLLYAVFAYPFALVLGIPAYLLMSRVGSLSVLRVTLTGAILGLISGAVLLLLLRAEWVHALDGGMFVTVSIFAVFGAITAWVFWWLALRPRASTLTLGAIEVMKSEGAACHQM